ISLIARFEPLNKGNLITSDQTRQRLPGQGPLPGSNTAIVKTATNPGVQQATVKRSTLEPERNFVDQINYEDSTAEGSKTPRMTTTSISLPNSFRRLSGNVTVPVNEPAREVKAATPTANDSTPRVSNRPVESAADIDFVGTQVNYLTAEESARRSLPPRSSDSRPASHQAQAIPVSQ